MNKGGLKVNSLNRTFQSFIKLSGSGISFLFLSLLILTFQVKGQKNEQKGDWETLKIINLQPTNIKNFAQAFPIGNRRLGAKVLVALH